MKDEIKELLRKIDGKTREEIAKMPREHLTEDQSRCIDRMLFKISNACEAARAAVESGHYESSECF